MRRNKSKKQAQESAATAPVAVAQEPSEAPAGAEAEAASPDVPVAAAVTEAPPAPPPPQSYPTQAPSEHVASEEHPVSQYMKLSDLLANPSRTSEQQRQQAAAADLMAALAPSRELLLEEVPEASSPEEATRILQEREESNAIPDPRAQALARNDIYWSDTSVYYRLRKQIYLLPRRLGARAQFVPPAGLAGRPAVGKGPVPTQGRLPSPSLD